MSKQATSNWTASVDNYNYDLKGKDREIDLGSFENMTRDQAAKAAAAKILATHDAKDAMLYVYSGKNETEYVYRLGVKKGLTLWRKAWTDKDGYEHERQYNRKVSISFVHGVMVVGL